MIRGKKIITQNKPGDNRKIGVTIHNRFDFEVVDKNTGKVKQKAYAENVICNSLWTRLCSANSWNTYIHYGDGTGTPSSADTSLFSFLGYLSSSLYSHSYDYNNSVYKVTKKSVLDETLAVGKTLSEVGIAYSTSASSLMTHAMLQDMNGNPVSLEKTDTDIVNIYATVFCHFSYPEHTRVLGSVKYFSGISEGILSHIAGLSSMPTVQIYPGFGYVLDATSNNALGSATITYNSGNRTITFSSPRASAPSWNLYSGIKTLFLCRGSYYGPEVVFEIEEGNGWYEVTKVTGESIGTGDGTTKDFTTSIAYAKNAKVYVDGVEVAASCDYTVPHESLLNYFRMLKAPALGRNFRTHSSPLYRDGNNNYLFSKTNLKDVAILENMLWETVGVKSLYSNYYSDLVAYASQDMVEWVEISGGNSSGLTVPDAYQNYRYWKFHTTNTNNQASYTLSATPNADLPSSVNLHLAEAPPAGSVITADYDTVCVGKDSNHVFDFSVTFQFNEHSEAQ